MSLAALLYFNISKDCDDQALLEGLRTLAQEMKPGFYESKKTLTNEPVLQKCAQILQSLSPYRIAALALPNNKNAVRILASVGCEFGVAPSGVLKASGNGTALWFAKSERAESEENYIVKAQLLHGYSKAGLKVLATGCEAKSGFTSMSNSLEGEHVEMLEVSVPKQFAEKFIRGFLEAGFGLGVQITKAKYHSYEIKQSAFPYHKGQKQMICRAEQYFFEGKLIRTTPNRSDVEQIALQYHEPVESVRLDILKAQKRWQEAPPEFAI